MIFCFLDHSYVILIWLQLQKVFHVASSTLWLYMFIVVHAFLLFELMKSTPLSLIFKLNSISLIEIQEI